MDFRWIYADVFSEVVPYVNLPFREKGNLFLGEVKSAANFCRFFYLRKEIDVVNILSDNEVCFDLLCPICQLSELVNWHTFFPQYVNIN